MMVVNDIVCVVDNDLQTLCKRLMHQIKRFLYFLRLEAIFSSDSIQLQATLTKP